MRDGSVKSEKKEAFEEVCERILGGGESLCQGP